MVFNTIDITNTSYDDVFYDDDSLESKRRTMRLATNALTTTDRKKEVIRRKSESAHVVYLFGGFTLSVLKTIDGSILMAELTVLYCKVLISQCNLRTIYLLNSNQEPK